MFRNHTKTIVMLVCALSLLAAAGCGQQKSAVGRAKLQLKRNDYAGAIKSIRSAPPEVRNTYDAQIVLARAYRGAEKYDNSIKAYKKAASLEKKQTLPFIGMAEVEEDLSGKATSAAEKAKHQMRAIGHCDAALLVDKKSSEVYATRARLYEARDEFEKALQDRQNAITYDPDNPSRKLDKAKTLLRLKRPEEARVLVDEVVVQDPSNVEALAVKAELVLRARKPGYLAKVIELLTRAALPEKTKPELRGPILRNLSSFCIEAGDLEAAKKWTAELRKYPRFRGDVLYQEGAILVREEKWKEAYERLKLLEDSGFPYLLMQLALVEEKLDMHNQAIGHYKKVTGLAPKYLPPHLALARLLLARNLFQEAMGHCNIILKERPAHEGALWITARIYRTPSSPLHDNTQAQLAYKKILTHNPTSLGANLDLADLFLEQLQPRLAIIHATRANTVKETSIGHVALGRAYLLRHIGGRNPATGPTNIEIAITHLEKAYAKDEKSMRAVEWLARAYAAAEESKTSNKAVVLLRDHISKNLRQGPVYIALANHLERMKNLPEAVKVMERAARVRGIQGFSVSLLGRAYFLAGRYEDAVKIWEQVLVGADMKGAPIALRLSLATALAADGQHAKALTRADAALHESAKKQDSSVLVGACLAIQAGQYGRATQFIDTHEYASDKTKQPYLDLIDICKKAGPDGQEAARAMGEGIMHTELKSIDIALERFRAAEKLLPQSPIPLYLQLSTLTRTRRFKSVPRIFKTIFKKFPEDGFAHYQFAMLKNRFPNEVDQLAHLELALDFDPKLAVAHMALAEALVRESQTASAKAKAPLLDQALDHCKEALELQNGGTRKSLELTARVHYAITKLRRAKLLEEENPAEIVAKRALARKSAASTRSLLQMLQNKYPSSVPAIRIRVSFELLEKQYATAADLASNFMKNQKSGDTSLHLLFIQALIKQGKYDRRPAKLAQAMTELQRLIEINPLNMAAHASRVSLYEAMKRHDLVVATMAHMRLLDRNNIQVAVKLAEAYLKINQPAKAMVIYDEIIKSVERAAPNNATRARRRLSIVGSARCLTLMPTSTEADRLANINKAMAALSPLTTASVRGRPYVNAMLLQGDLLQKLGKLPEALRLYEEAEALAPKNYGPLRALAIFHHKQRQYGKVIGLLQGKIIPRREYNPFEYSRLALTLIVRNAPGDVKRAQEAAAKARDLMSRQTELQKEVPEEIVELYLDTEVLVYVAGKKYHDARTVVMKGVSNTMQRTAHLRLIDRCSRNRIKRREFIVLFANHTFLSSLGETTESLTHLKKLLARFPGNYYLLTRLRAVHRRRYETKKEADVLEQLIVSAEAPSSVMTRSDLRKLYVNLISTYILRLAPHTRSAVGKADAACERALKKWPRSVAILELHATVRSRQRNLPELVAALKRAAAAAKKGSAAWIRVQKELALVYPQMNKHDKSLDVCDLIQEYVRSDAQWQNNWAWLLATAPTPDLEKAIIHATRAKTLHPTKAEIRDTLGWVLYLAGEYRRAHPELLYAAQQKPRDPSLRYHLGVNYAKLKKYEKALEALEKAMTLSRQSRGAAFQDKDACQKLIAEVTAKLPAASP